MHDLDSQEKETSAAQRIEDIEPVSKSTHYM